MTRPSFVLTENSTIPDAAQLDADAFLQAMRSVAASVTVVTTDGPGGRAGATVSSFTSVSVAPPTVLVCLATESRIARAVRENGRFTVNVLSTAMSDLAVTFSGRGEARPEDGPAVEPADRFEGVDWYAHEDGSPIIRGAGAFVCRLEKTTVVATHDVCFGRVEAIDGDGAPPLAYLDRAFSRVVSI